MNATPYEHIKEPEKGTDKATLAERIICAVGAGGATAGILFLWYFDPTKHSFFPACPMYSMTGYACSGCGLTRGFHALFHGDIWAALGYNALIPVFLLLFGFLYFSMMWVAATGRQFPRWSISLPAVWGFLILLIVFSVVRNIPYYPFNLLFP